MIRIVEVLDECRGSMRGFVLVAVIMMVSCCFTGCLENEEEDCCVEENLPPSVVNVNIGPDEAFSTYELTCDWLFNDEEGGEDSSYVTWSVNGIEVGSGTSISGVFSAGDTVTCTVTANDGEIDGNSASDSITIFEPSPPCPEEDKELGTEPGGFDNFITRQGDRLYDGSTPFRFISFNVPSLLAKSWSWAGGPDTDQEDAPPEGESWEWKRAEEWEQEDAIVSVAQMGGNVLRTYTLSVGQGEFFDTGAGETRHVIGNGDGTISFNEELFQDLDRAVAIARENCVRLIIPIIDNAGWWGWGGMEDLVEIWNEENEDKALGVGVVKEDFWTHEDLKDYYKQIADSLVNRVNTVTGVAYKDDPTILAWETGNELAHELHEYPSYANNGEDVAEWTAEMAAWLKENAPNQLVVDGRYGVYLDALSDDNVDIVSDHYYKRYDSGAKYSSDVYGDLLLISDAAEFSSDIEKKPLLNGEFGFVNTTEISNLLDTTIANPGIVGALIWMLSFHYSVGGFVYHSDGCIGIEEIMGSDDDFEEREDGLGCEYAPDFWRAYSYHWPGFPSGDEWHETEILWLMREKAFQIRGLELPEIEAPDAPLLLEYSDDPTTPPEFVWRGSTGASEYSLWRSESEQSDWVMVKEGFDDSPAPNYAYWAWGGKWYLMDTNPPVVVDDEVGSGTWYYCVKAHNQGGESDCSNVVGPITIR